MNRWWKVRGNRKAGCRIRGDRGGPAGGPGRTSGEPGEGSEGGAQASQEENRYPEGDGSSEQSSLSRSWPPGGAEQTRASHRWVPATIEREMGSNKVKGMFHRSQVWGMLFGLYGWRYFCATLKCGNLPNMYAFQNTFARVALFSLLSGVLLSVLKCGSRVSSVPLLPSLVSTEMSAVRAQGRRQP